MPFYLSYDVENIVRTFQNEATKAFGELSQPLIESAKVLLLKNKNVASRRHIDSLTTKLELKGKYMDFYLYSTAKSPKGFSYDIIVLNGAKFTSKGPPPPAILLWIKHKKRRGAFSNVNKPQELKSLSFAISANIKKRGRLKMLPYDYVGAVITHKNNEILNKFKVLEKL